MHLKAGDHLRMPGRGAEGDGLCSSFYYCIVLYFTYLYSQCESSVREWMTEVPLALPPPARRSSSVLNPAVATPAPTCRPPDPPHARTGGRVVVPRRRQAAWEAGGWGRGTSAPVANTPRVVSIFHWYQKQAGLPILFFYSASLLNWCVLGSTT